MDAAAELGRNPASSTRFSLSMEMSRLTQDETDERTRLARPNSQAHKRGQGTIHFSCSAHHEQDWQPYPVDPYYFCYMCDYTYIPALYYTILHF